MKRKYKLILLCSVFAIFCLTLSIYFLRPEPAAARAVIREDLADSFTIQGALIPESTQTLFSEVGGRVLSAPQIGAVLLNGSLAAELDESDARELIEDQLQSLRLEQIVLRSQQQIEREQLDAQLRTAKLDYDRMFGSGQTAAADLAAAQAAYDLAQAEYHNGSVLQQQGFLSKQNLGELYARLTGAGQALAQARAASSEETKNYYEAMIHSYELSLASLDGGEDVSSARKAADDKLQITIDQLEKKLGKQGLTVPYEAVVWEVFAQPGDYVTEKQPLVAVYPSGALKLQAEVLARDVTGLTPSMEASCSLADGRTFQASISFVSLVAKEQLSSVGLTESRCLVELTADPLPDGLGAGHPVDITFSPVLARDTLTLPLSCVVPTDGGYGVYVLHGHKKVLTEVEVGIRCSGRAQILSGVQEGDMVILEP